MFSIFLTPLNVRCPTHLKIFLSHLGMFFTCGPGPRPILDEFVYDDIKCGYFQTEFYKIGSVINKNFVIFMISDGDFTAKLKI